MKHQVNRKTTIYERIYLTGYLLIMPLRSIKILIDSEDSIKIFCKTQSLIKLIFKFNNQSTVNKKIVI